MSTPKMRMGGMACTSHCFLQTPSANLVASVFSTPLHVAVAKSNTYDICRKLLESGADLGNCDADRKTPLHTFFNPIIGRLLQCHRDTVTEEISKRDCTGMTILQYAAWSSKSQPQHLEPYVHSTEGMAMLLARDNSGRSLLQFATQRGNVSLVRYLLSLPTDIGLETRDASGQSTLHYAVQSKRSEVIDLLLARSRNLPVVDGNGRTWLHAAATKNSLIAAKRVVRILGESSLNVKDERGMTPFDLARQCRALETAAYLASLVPAEMANPGQRSSTTSPDKMKSNTNITSRCQHSWIQFLCVAGIFLFVPVFLCSKMVVLGPSLRTEKGGGGFLGEPYLGTG